MLRGLRSAAALLRGAAGLTLASHHAAPAGAGAQAAAELAHRLGQGCAPRHAATAAGGDESGRVPPKEKSTKRGQVRREDGGRQAEAGRARGGGPGAARLFQVRGGCGGAADQKGVTQTTLCF